MSTLSRSRRAITPEAWRRYSAIEPVIGNGFHFAHQSGELMLGGVGGMAFGRGHRLGAGPGSEVGPTEPKERRVVSVVVRVTQHGAMAITMALRTPILANAWRAESRSGSRTPMINSPVVGSCTLAR